MTSPLGVLVVEDDALTRSTMAAALRAGGFDVVGEATSAAHALRLADELTVDAALIDLDLGRGPTGLDLAVALRARKASIGIVLLTSYDDPRLLAADLPGLPPGGVYLRKRQVSSVDDVRRAIDRAARIPVAAQAISGSRDHGLSDAQFALLRDIARGQTNAQMAQARDVTVSAVEKGIRRLIAALGIREDGNQRAQLIQAYLRMVGRNVSSG